MKRGKTTRDWDRGQVTVRLTSRRKELLMLLAAREAVSGGPTSAIDRAIDLAMAPSGEPLEAFLEELESRLARADSERAAEAASFAQTAAGLEAAVSQLADALRALLGEH